VDEFGVQALACCHTKTRAQAKACTPNSGSFRFCEIDSNSITGSQALNDDDFGSIRFPELHGLLLPALFGSYFDN
jgi:hypothetical protein